MAEEPKERKDPKPELKPLGARLLALRLARNLTHREVADGAGMSVQQYQRIESAEDEPKYLSLIGIARGLQVDPGAVLSDNYPADVPLVRRQPPVGWKTLEDAARFLEKLAADMTVYETPPAPPSGEGGLPPAKKARGPRRR